LGDLLLLLSLTVPPSKNYFTTKWQIYYNGYNDKNMTYTCMINPTYTIQQSIPIKKKRKKKENISLNRENPSIKE
jgi:hypothetical protein